MFEQFNGTASIAAAAFKKDKDSGKPSLAVTLQFGLVKDGAAAELIALWNAQGSVVRVTLEPATYQQSLPGIENSAADLMFPAQPPPEDFVTVPTDEAGDPLPAVYDETRLPWNIGLWHLSANESPARTEAGERTEWAVQIGHDTDFNQLRVIRFTGSLEEGVVFAWARVAQIEENAALFPHGELTAAEGDQFAAQRREFLEGLADVLEENEATTEDDMAEAPSNVTPIRPATGTEG